MRDGCGCTESILEEESDRMKYGIDISCFGDYYHLVILAEMPCVVENAG